MPRPRCVWDLPQRSMRTTRLRGCCCTQVLFKRANPGSWSVGTTQGWWRCGCVLWCLPVEGWLLLAVYDWHGLQMGRCLVLALWREHCMLQALMMGCACECFALAASLRMYERTWSRLTLVHASKA